MVFRHEVMGKARIKGMNVLLDTRGFNFFHILTATIIIIISFILLFSLGAYTRRNEVQGEVTSPMRPIYIKSQYQGYISETYISPKDKVKKGDVLFKIAIGKNIKSGNLSEQSINSIILQQEKIKEIIEGLKKSEINIINNLKVQRNRYVALMESSGKLLNESRRGLDDYTKFFNDYRIYQQKGLITKDQYIIQLNNLYQQRSLFNSINTQNAQENLQLINTDAEIDEKKIYYKNQILEYELKLKELERQKEILDSDSEIFIIASYNGQIETVNITTGQSVNINSNLAQLVPDSHSTLELTLWVPDSNLPYIDTGDSVNIRYDAFAWQKFGQFKGKIKHISKVPASVEEMSGYRSAPIEELTKRGGNYYKVICTLNENEFEYEGRHIYLANGLTANVTLYLEQRSLWQWIISPVYEIKRSLQGVKP